MENTIRLSQDLTWRNRTDERVEALRALQPLSLDAAHGEEDCAFSDLLAAPPFVLPDPADEEAERHQAKRAQVEALLARLAPREQQVLRLRYGLDEADGRCHAPTAIARLLGLDCSTVCNLEQHALRKLRALAEPEAEQAHHPRTCRRAASPCSPMEQAERRQEQTQRLEAACAELVAQGIPICVRTLARTSHVDKKVIGPFVRLYWDQQGSEQERLEAACAELEAEGTPVTKASPQERLSEAYTHLLAQGESVTRARLRQEAGVSTDAAGAFLRAQRAGDANPDLP